MFGWLRRAVSRKPTSRVVTLNRVDWERDWDRIGVGYDPNRAHLAAKYDVAQNTPDSRKHWQQADALSANAANSATVRQLLRNRSRYECANNTHAQNLLLALGNYTVGTAVRLQMVTKNSQFNQDIEREFTRWALSVDLFGKLRTMRMTKARDGEAFATFVKRENPLSPVQLDLRLYEAEQVATPNFQPVENAVDGIVFNPETMLPQTYHLLKRHPGDAGASTPEKIDVSAANVLHYYRVDRPGQMRGIPEIMAALPLFALLRRYGLATCAAAEQAAAMSAVMKTNAPPAGDDEGEGAGQAASIPLGMSIEVERNMLTALPDGWELQQLKAEQPTTTFGDFNDKILGNIGCVLQIPFNVIACNSSGYNYASGRLDYQGFDLSLKVERATIEQQILDRVFAAWFAEAQLIPGLLSVRDDTLDPLFLHEWNWDGRDHVDPLKEAGAQEIALSNGTTTLKYEYGKRGRDYETETDQWAAEKGVLMQKLIDNGFSRAEALAVIFNKAPKDMVVQSAAA